ncbi:MAG: YbhB/YbcL family Raf kinase inhibitor-like protein [Candidatus Niyogibacteria bacterium CG10_big_fil_rev_8_21_14_0_10_46_36]|uniref:YbhB/YbcL family Raf kinase inhibitor-like protein n=1 Tax=Candidatus Niyogibacteria bacterium CG10_big_fil_rev_8_21_14_0_10_46_36 TaxID=1974726 RepID=A0A2H0TCP9_9BACT|nr:MAG: YbhB/YbcL family Raf kinase inhibitor-like protein [Candidatus Niyogibacteria bacterium CG10_big_fil_rev_8_21_14_0_10_46_36]
MQLTSPVFEHNGKIPSLYTCDSENISPPLAILDVPEEAKSLVLIMDDPDAIKPAGKVWDHWIIWNIPPGTEEIKEGEEPDGVFGTGSGNNKGYRGPCPPDGEHRYYFKLYALDTELDIPEGSTKGQVEGAMNGHILTQTELIGLYVRN